MRTVHQVKYFDDDGLLYKSATPMKMSKESLPGKNLFTNIYSLFNIRVCLTSVRQTQSLTHTGVFLTAQR
jgi:hypothetical protein